MCVGKEHIHTLCISNFLVLNRSTFLFLVTWVCVMHFLRHISPEVEGKRIKRHAICVVPFLLWPQEEQAREKLNKKQGQLIFFAH